jgi:hypothetical protein
MLLLCACLRAQHPTLSGITSRSGRSLDHRAITDCRDAGPFLLAPARSPARYATKRVRPAGVPVVVAPEITTTTSNSVVSTASDGTFRLANIPDGKYILSAADENDPNLMIGNYEDYEDILARVEIRAGERIAKELKRHPRAR